LPTLTWKVSLESEKPTPHYKLVKVRELLAQGRIRTTQSALRGAAALGMDFGSMCRVVEMLNPRDFCKSMTTHSNHRIWQDVYRPNTLAGTIYLKITVVEDLLIVSFKEL
jgi:motility quorum-sensing regulator/GCU-specific mRNA interferase toxin